MEIKTSMLVNSDFASDIILSCFCLFSSFIDLYILIILVFTQTFNPIVELVTPTGIQLKKQKQKWKHIQ